MIPESEFCEMEWIFLKACVIDLALVLLCNTTPRRASVATNGLWHVAARAWHEPPADACSVVSAHPSHLDR